MVRIIWQRYFIKQFLQTFFFFLFCFYGLYVLIDYATHTSALSNHHVQIDFRDIISYYFYVFSARAEILIPIALLIAFVKRVTTLNNQQELVAMMASGVGLKKLLQPFLLFALLVTLLLFLNTEFILPKALKKVRQIENSTKQQKKRLESNAIVHQIILEDGSLLLYQSYDPFKERFFDLFWIPSIDELYRIKYLYPKEKIPVGYYVDRLKREPSGELLQKEEVEKMSFPEMRFNSRILQSNLTEPEYLSLSTLFNKTLFVTYPLDEKDSKILTALYWKLAMPFLCLLAIIAPAPFCIRFSRQMPLFFIFILSLFGLIAFYMFMDAAQIVAVRQILNPAIAILLPFSLVFFYFGWRYIRI